MQINRRDFLKWITASAAALGLTSLDLVKVEQALAASTSPPVIWLQGAMCTGCSISLLNAANPTIDDVLLNKVSVKYHPNLAAAAGDLAVTSIIDTSDKYAGEFILCIEGGIPTGVNGKYCVIADKGGKDWTMLDAVNELGSKAKYVIAVGTCAAFGGVVKPSTYTGIKTVAQVLKGKTKNTIINLPSCPVHPNVMVGTIVTLLTKGMPRLDRYGRPVEYYTTYVHNNCPRRHTTMVDQYGKFGCYKGIGCKGPSTVFTCPLLKWNNGVNWCIDKANMQCISCASPTFPAGPFYYGGMGDMGSHSMSSGGMGSGEMGSGGTTSGGTGSGGMSSGGM
ncbi:hydrogenase small subunit [Thermanaerosceptrum fracticalcis]|uniref:Hydrogenase small subunit n=1 Tax=Thermanaerosceptrum fracticalcis TaxID=1712410 RepID=A0A7G6E3X7_THEFR|nr:hydrogenase small subunit [Thermanaerosceptrum fracticalcis]QNB46781.1 hydrogenase small subunit [Thermanaerosceptrum fracticalcis]